MQPSSETSAGRGSPRLADDPKLGPVTDGVAPDGSPVAVYRALPAEYSFEPVLDVLPPAATILDLGCGVGRLANLLAAAGHEVTGVDESREMLRHLDGAVTPVEARIEELRLPESFDVVVLASHLINTGDPQLRRGFLATAAHHVAPQGTVLIEHLGTDTEALPDSSEGDVGEVHVSFRVLERRGDRFDGMVTYQLGDREWVQRFTGELLDDTKLAAALRDARLEIAQELSPTWIAATPAS